MLLREKYRLMNFESACDSFIPSNEKKSISEFKCCEWHGSKYFKCCRNLGFSYSDLTSWKNFVQLLYRPKDPASLGVVRALFGLLMVFDIPEERGLSEIDVKWGDPSICYFPLFNFLSPLPLPWMGIIYLIMWCGAMGIMLGFMFRISCLSFLVPYWYLFFLDKSVWNNHSYLYGIVGVLLLGSNANFYWSLDCYLGTVRANTHVPLWNYTALRFQFFLLYFYAGLKKMDRDWLEGYSMTHLNQHWIFEPFKLLLTSEQVDYWIVHVAGFLLDLTIGFWLLFDKTRPYAFFFCSSFHLMNSRLFTIGMFPYVCLASLPIFSHADWPRKFFKLLKTSDQITLHQNDNCMYHSISGKKGKYSKKKSEPSPSNLTWKHNVVVSLLLCHVGLQVFLPYSHFITKGYNNWTNGLYGYSWDMMVHSWDTILVVVKVVDNDSGKEHFIDSEAWVLNNRWTKHADMIVQYGQCLKRNLMREREKNVKLNDYITSDNISLYIDVWSSLNGRFQQRMFDPRVNILTARWAPLEETSWLMPLLVELSTWRENMEKMASEVYSWSNFSDVLFVADFPGLQFENYIHPELSNVTLTVLKGTVILQEDREQNHTLSVGKQVDISVGRFHSIHTLPPHPSCFMYTFSNNSLTADLEHHKNLKGSIKNKIITSLNSQIDNFVRAITLVSNSFLNIVWSVPMVKRVRIG